jgi:lactoylglutathione lyase
MMNSTSVRMSHVGLAVSDLEASLRFYSEGLGFEVGARFEAGDDVAAVSEVEPPVRSRSQYLSKDGFRLELLDWEIPGVQGSPSAVRNQLGLTHLCLEVDDLAETTDRLIAAGATEVPGASVVVERGPLDIAIAVLADPDGTRIELLERREVER